MNAALEALVGTRSLLLVFIPSADQLRRFVLTGAFDGLAARHDLHYVVPGVDAARLRAAAPDILTEASTSELDVPGDRLAAWMALADLARAGAADYKQRAAATTARLGRLPALVDLLERRHPLYCIVPTAFRDAFCNEVVAACRKKVSCVLLESEPDSLTSKVVHSRTPFLGSLDQKSAQQAVKIQGIPAACVRALGAPEEPRSYAERLAAFCLESVEPEARRFQWEFSGQKRSSISHAYGARDIAAAYCGVPAAGVEIPGYWMHGWIPSFHNVHPVLIALHKRKDAQGGYDHGTWLEDDKAQTLQLVSRADQADYLRAHGYARVRAVGLPIVYLPGPAVERVPASLLVLPPHGQQSHGAGDRLAEDYAAAIADLRGRFDHVCVGLTEDDLVREQWVPAFRRHGIDVIMTAQQSDTRTLQRLTRILSGFEYVTTNGFGSQIAYAAYCGAKVSVYGPFAEFPPERMASTHAIRIVPDLMAQAISLCGEQALRTHYPFLFVDPDRAQARPEWGAFEVGGPCRLSPAGLASLIGGTPR